MCAVLWKFIAAYLLERLIDRQIKITIPFQVQSIGGKNFY